MQSSRIGRGFASMTSSVLTKLVVEARAADLGRAVAARRNAGDLGTRLTRDADQAITIRVAQPRDALALAELADLDCAPVPAEPVLLAEVDGRLRAALSLRDGASVADPFHLTQATVGLLVARAAQLSPESRRSWLIGRLPRAARAWRGPLSSLRSSV